MDAPIHLRPTAEIAPRALVPGDPGRALLLAQALLDKPLMCNHNRGLWGYTGRAADGEPLTIQSTGMGGPSAAIVVAELIDLGVEALVRVGTCGAIAAGIGLGELIVATGALAADGASRALGAGERVAADPDLSAALTAEHRGVVATTDLFYDPEGEARQAAWAAAGALAVEMEAATVLQVARRRGVRAACLLAVTDVLTGGARARVDEAGYAAAGLRLGSVAAAALAA
jgi:DeoD family purine-nucleoside phosphorylase